MDWRTHCRNIVPLAALLAVATFLANAAYAYLSISLLLVVKGFLPVILVPLTKTLVDWTYALEPQAWIQFGLIAGGIMVAVIREADYNPLGIMQLLLAAGLESLRRVMSEKTTELMGLHPVEQLLYLTPTAAVISAVSFLVMEVQRLDSLIMFRTEAHFVVLNVVSLSGIYLTSLLVHKPSKVASSTYHILRDLLVLFVVIFALGTSLAGMQLFGYAIAATAFMWYQNAESLRRNFRHSHCKAFAFGITFLLTALAAIMLLNTKYGLDVCDKKEHEKLVIVSRTREDVSWMPLHLGKCIPYIIYEKDNPQAEHRMPNKGNEASAYLKFILDNWQKLPERMAFIHGHRQSWHSTAPIDELLLRGNWDAAPFIKIPATYRHTKNLANSDVGNSEDEEGNLRLKIFWNRFYAKHLGPLPDFVEYTCCAQFIVHNTSVYSRPRAMYQDIYDFLMSDEWPDYWSGRMLEYTWHVLFTGRARESRVSFG
ncbi:hypothetical protein HDU85_000847 [Gaertneriomyces sp. JEL0708]|nr:hypothetical protein HDU85_000847 [Gaertneriomyces sp. JEL0708]